MIERTDSAVIVRQNFSVLQVHVLREHTSDIVFAGTLHCFVRAFVQCAITTVNASLISRQPSVIFNRISREKRPWRLCQTKWEFIGYFS